MSRPSEDRDFSFGVVPVFNESGRPLFLLVQHRAGHWSFPKGHAEPGERPLDAARRELEEETGLRDVGIDARRTFVEHYDTVRRGRDVEKTVTYFLGTARSRAVRVQPEEIRDHAWLPFEEALARITYEETRRVLREAERTLHG